MGDEPRRGPGRPATGQVPVRTVRVGPVWDQAKAIAEAEGTKFSDVIDELLKRYVARASAEGRGRYSSSVNSAQAGALS